MARVDTAQVLAMVNQTPLRLRDLMPVGPRETSKVLSPEQYHSRLQRAIEMELTFQAAHSQGAELTGAQQQRVEQIAGSDRLEPEGYENAGLSWSSVGAEQVEFEKRVLAAQMLEQNLVAQKAGVFPSPDREMQSRYELARRELLDQLRKNANITKGASSL